MVLLASKNQHKIKYTGQNHLNNSGQLHIVQRPNKQTKKYIQARREVGRSKKMLYDGDDLTEIFTHVQVARQPHLGQHLHVPLSQADMVIDDEFEN
jgi:hypothetical protein